MRKGFSLIIILIIFILVGIIVFSLYKNSLLPIPARNASPSDAGGSILKSPSPTPTPTATPTAKPTTAPTAIPTKNSTPKPTAVVISGPPGTGYSSVTVHTEKGDFAASILSIDLNGARVVTDTANDSDCNDNCATLSLADFVNRNGGFAGVNGTYFCPATYPDCASKKDSFDFPVYNSRLNKWINGGNLFWNSRSIVYFDGSGVHYNQNANGFSGGLTAGIVNYPGLVNGGQVQIDDNQSGLSDKQRTVGSKIGIGIRGEKNLMVVRANAVNMQQFAYVFKALGATGALNLDTGGSAAIYNGGRYIIGPGRNLPNAIIFVK